MSLKAFHIVFISFSSILAFFFGTWLLAGDIISGPLRVFAGVTAYLVGLTLVLYGRYFLRKYRHFSFI